jgi:type IV pilus assembly protein PilQ
LEDTAFISKVRVGAHADKTRVVLDLNGSPFEYTTQVTPSGVSLTLTSDSVGSAPRAQFSPKTEFSPKSDGSAVAAGTTQVVEAPIDEIAASEISPAASNDGSEPARVIGLSIQNLDTQDNMMLAELSAPGAYSLKRTAPSEYVLTVEGAALDPVVNQTIVSPPSSGQIRSVRPVVQGENVLFRIFTTPNSTLRVQASGSRIAVLGGASDLANSRAQANPEVVEAEPAAAAAATPAAAPATGGDDLASLLGGSNKYNGRLISLDLQDTDIDNALRIIAEVSNLNIIASDDVTGKVTLRLIDVPWDQALDVLLKTNGLDKVQEGNVVRIAPVEKLRAERESLKASQEAEDALEPLVVRYIRVSYARSSELKPLVETVISERGTVTYDDRTNQLIVKDIQKGIKNVAELVSKIDLRTPQVLLETQIVEASRSMFRELGSELGFNFVQSPATGNATGSNFPNSIGIGGGLANNTASAFPAAVSAGAGSAVNFLLGSADGSASITARLTALERQGRIRVISRPAVATTNNKQALIKSVEKIRVKTPSGGVSVATGQGAAASGSSTTATETIEVGIQLEVTPQASPDYYVLLDVRAKSSTFGSRTVEGIPSEIERSANSTVLVSSGQTFAMGGIYKISDRDSSSGTPFLKDVPVLGTLFRNSLVDNADEELLFFITPRIIEGSFDDAAMKMTS